MVIDGLILCEGETDQALLSYYLGRVRGWKYIRLKDMPFPTERICWYQDANNRVMGIWPVGCNDFLGVLSKVFEMEKIEHRVKKIAIVTDNDDNSTESVRIKQLFSGLNDMVMFNGFDDQMYKDANNKWISLEFESAFGKALIEVTYLLVPFDKHGALETFMLSALSENDEDKKMVISKIKKFIDNAAFEKYLRKRRQRIKAELGMSVAVFTPDKVFSEMDELIMSVDWERFDITNKQFEILKDI